MPPVTMRKYDIRCRRGHIARVHVDGCCHPCREEDGVSDEQAWYQFEDNGERWVIYPHKHDSLPSLMRCAECDGWTNCDQDYLCSSCRA